MLRYGFVILTFKQNLLSILLVLNSSSCQSLHEHIPFLILLNAELISIALIKQIDQSFIV